MGDLKQMCDYRKKVEATIDSRIGDLISALFEQKRHLAQVRDRAEFHGEIEFADIIRKISFKTDKQLKLMQKVKDLEP